LFIKKGFAMDKKEKLLQVFTEEANEIIEELDRLVMQLEEGGDTVSLVNDIFRGVHTLKGSANSFGFTRLGEYVHHWEDLLGIFRDNPTLPIEESIDLLFDAVNVVRDVFAYEINGKDGFPANYDETLSEIKNKMNNAANAQTKSVQTENEDIIPTLEAQKIEPQFDLTYEVAALNTEELKTLNPDELTQITASVGESKNLYNVVLCFDDDLYFRGHNQQVSIRLLDEIGDIVKSYWYFNTLVSLEEYNNEHNYINQISLYLLTDLTHTEVEEIFEFTADDNEVKIRHLSLEDLNSALKEEPTIEEIDEIQVEEKKDKPAKKSISENSNVTETVKTQSYIRIESGKIDELFDSVGELVIAQSYIENSEVVQESNNVALKKNINTLSKSTKRIQDQVMSLRMVAIRDTFFKMKRIARDVAKKTGKEFDFILKGEDTEIDKTMVDALSDPLIHLIRNAIDHGLESDEERKAQNKPKGKVSLDAYHRGDNIVIEIKDDGKGIDSNKILTKAIDRGLVEENNTLTESEIINFIFHPGFSMAKEISDVSGRGVGLDVVKTSIDKLKGKTDITTKMGEGSSFKIILPLTLAIIDGMIVSINGEIFIIPTLSVVESFSPNMKNVSSVQNKEEFIDFRGDVLPIVHLNRLLNLEGEERKDADSVFICIEHDRGRFILRVDSLLGRQQVVVKSMGKFLNFVKEIVGGAILGDGKIALILNIEEIRVRLDEIL
jgi:two-component system chemotaxis sensor kinase CheA